VDRGDSCGKDLVGETGDEDEELSEGYAWMAGLGGKDGAGAGLASELCGRGRGLCGAVMWPLVDKEGGAGNAMG
jgi:hypothetical protein